MTQFGTAPYATILNGTIQQGQGEADVSPAIAVMENSGTGWTIHDMALQADGAKSRAIYSKTATNATIYNNHIYNPQRAVPSRDGYDGAAIKVEYAGYGNSIHDNTVYEGVQTAFYLQQTAGQTKNEVHHNTIALQAFVTNDFAIVANGAKVYNNTVNCHEGDNSCRGITTGGTDTIVYDNIVNVRELPRNQEYNGCESNGAYGLQMEYATTGLQVYGNTVTAYADVCEAHAFRANPYIVGSPESSNNVVHDNLFIAIANGDAAASTIKYSILDGNDVNVYDNTFRTNDRWIYVDGGGPVTDPTFTGNHWETSGTLKAPFYPFAVFTWADSHFTGTFYGNTYGTGDQARFEDAIFVERATLVADPLSSFVVTVLVPESLPSPASGSEAPSLAPPGNLKVVN